MGTGSAPPGSPLTPDGTGCPASEVLAAFVDRGVTPVERAAIEAHLADCHECRFLIARILDVHDGVHATPAATARVSAFQRPARRWVGRTVGALVAAAAALLLIVQMPRWWPGSPGSVVDSRLADLADAVGDERTVEARLTGGFRHGPLRASVRSGGSLAPLDNWKLYAAAGRIREQVQQDPASGNLHALGLAHLLIGNYDDAVQALEDAVAEDTGNAQYHSDLAAAYLARAKQHDRPDDLPRALAASEKAISGDARLAEAKFNRALALESLHLAEPARRAWQDYLVVDASSPWAEEARRHLASLQSSGTGPTDPARNNSPPPIGENTVEAGLDWVLRHGLPAWAEAIAAGDHSRASSEQSFLANYTRQIGDAAGDALPVGLAALPPPDDRSSSTVAASVRGFGRGLQLIDADDLAGAQAQFGDACRDAPRSIAPLCSAELGMIDVLQRRDTSAAAHGENIRQAFGATASPYLEARWRRLEGFRALFAGNYALAREHYRAGHALAAGKYIVLAGQLASQLADLSSLAGLHVEAWRWREQALSAAARGHSNWLRAFAWMNAGWQLSRESNHRAARPFLASTPGSGLQRVPALLSQARAAIDDGDAAAGAEAIDAAEQIVTRSTDFRAVRMRAEVLSLKGQLAWQQRDLQAAEEALRESIGGMGPERTAQRAAVMLERAGIRSAAGADLAAAERDVVDAIELLSRSAPMAPSLPIDPQVAQRSIAALIAAKRDLQGPRGLALSDEVRQLVGGPAAERPALPTAEEMQALATALPADRAAIVFLFHEDSLLTWVLAGGAIAFEVRPVSNREVERRVATLAVQVTRAVKTEVWRETLAGLHDLLLRGLPGVGSARDLLVVVDGPLNRVPFGAMVDRQSGQFLFERASVRLAPSLAFGLRSAPSPSQEATVLSIGAPELTDDPSVSLPPLPRAREEAEMVARLYPRARTLIGPSATKARVLGELPTADVIHFAGHAVAGSGSAPRLLLAGAMADPATGLSVGDLTGRLHGSRVVLAGCETAASSAMDRSASRTHLATAFLRAGASSVVGSLWKVDDAVAAQFFTDVHRRLASGESTASAVAGAQRQCRGSPDCRRHPATWIGATVYGMH